MRGFITAALCFRGEEEGRVSRPSLLRYPHVFEIYAAASRGPSRPFPSISSAHRLLNLPEDEAHLRHIVGVGARDGGGWGGASSQLSFVSVCRTSGSHFSAHSTAAARPPLSQHSFFAGHTV